MKQALFFLVLLCFSHGLKVSFAGNVTLSNEEEFKFRSTSITDIELGLYTAVFFKSVGINAGNGAAAADVLVSAAVTAAGIAPSTYVSYFNVGVNTTGALDDPIKGISFSASKSIIANTYIQIDEIDVQGKLVKSADLGGIYGLRDASLTGGLNFQSFKKTFGSFNFELTAVFSDRIGVLDVIGKPIITPKSLETLLSISDWSYAKAENSLVLYVGIATLNLNVDATGALAAGSGTDGVFLNLATEAQVDGNSAAVKVSALTDLPVGDFGNILLAGQVQAKYSGGATFKLAKVTFPAGAKSIVYDPTIGAGSNPPQASGAAAFGLMFVAIIALLF